jgi:hypothetical protein
LFQGKTKSATPAASKVQPKKSGDDSSESDSDESDEDDVSTFIVFLSISLASI